VASHPVCLTWIKLEASAPAEALLPVTVLCLERGKVADLSLVKNAKKRCHGKYRVHEQLPNLSANRKKQETTKS